MAEAPTLPFDAEPTQAELRAAMVARARAKGFRVATRTEIDLLGPDQLFTSNLGGPVFVKIADHGDRPEEYRA